VDSAGVMARCRRVVVAVGCGHRGSEGAPPYFANCGTLRRTFGSVVHVGEVARRRLLG